VNVTERVPADVLAALSPSSGRALMLGHVHPDADVLGTLLALGEALEHRGWHVTAGGPHPAPAALDFLPGIHRWEVLKTLEGRFDVVVLTDCPNPDRTEGLIEAARGVAGAIVNIDHHPGNSNYGQINWFDASAAACGEMVFDLVGALGIPLTVDIATHVYLAILTDTGSFHYSSISPRTFDICRETLEAGVDPVLVARNVYDSNNMGRLKLFGAVLNRMHLDPTGRIATLSVDKQLTHDCGGTYEDTEGLINLPLTVKEILAVVFFKEIGPSDWRVSMRSKGNIDINAIAKEFGGGGHKNASGCSANGDLETLQAVFEQKITTAIERA